MKNKKDYSKQVELEGKSIACYCSEKPEELMTRAEVYGVTKKLIEMFNNTITELCQAQAVQSISVDTTIGILIKEGILNKEEYDKVFEDVKAQKFKEVKEEFENEKRR